MIESYGLHTGLTRENIAADVAALKTTVQKAREIKYSEIAVGILSFVVSATTYLLNQSKYSFIPLIPLIYIVYQKATAIFRTNKFLAESESILRTIDYKGDLNQADTLRFFSLSRCASFSILQKLWAQEAFPNLNIIQWRTIRPMHYLIDNPRLLMPILKLIRQESPQRDTVLNLMRAPTPSEIINPIKVSFQGTEYTISKTECTAMGGPLALFFGEDETLRSNVLPTEGMDPSEIEFLTILFHIMARRATDQIFLTNPSQFLHYVDKYIPEQCNIDNTVIYYTACAALNGIENDHDLINLINRFPNVLPFKKDLASRKMGLPIEIGTIHELIETYRITESRIICDKLDEWLRQSERSNTFRSGPNLMTAALIVESGVLGSRLLSHVMQDYRAYNFEEFRYCYAYAKQIAQLDPRPFNIKMLDRLKEYARFYRIRFLTNTYGELDDLPVDLNFLLEPNFY